MRRSRSTVTIRHEPGKIEVLVRVDGKSHHVQLSPEFGIFLAIKLLRACVLELTGQGVVLDFTAAKQATWANLLTRRKRKG